MSTDLGEVYGKEQLAQEYHALRHGLRETMMAFPRGRDFSLARLDDIHEWFASTYEHINSLRKYLDHFEDEVKDIHEAWNMDNPKYTGEVSGNNDDEDYDVIYEGETGEEMVEDEQLISEEEERIEGISEDDDDEPEGE